MDRRRFTIGVATLVLGGSGFVASGAFDVDSVGDSRGQGWVRLDEPDIVDPDVDDVGEVDDDDAPPTGEIRVQIVRDLEIGGRNRVDRLSERPRAVHSDFLAADEDGFLEAIDLHSMNIGAETRVGRLDGSGVPPSEQEVAFVIANVGGVGQPAIDGQEVRLTVNLYSDAAMEEPVRTDAIHLPWAIDEHRSGENLLGEPIQLAPRETIGVAIVVDGSVDDRMIGEVTTIGVTVERRR